MSALKKSQTPVTILALTMMVGRALTTIKNQRTATSTLDHPRAVLLSPGAKVDTQTLSLSPRTIEIENLRKTQTLSNRVGEARNLRREVRLISLVMTPAGAGDLGPPVEAMMTLPSRLGASTLCHKEASRRDYPHLNLLEVTSEDVASSMEGLYVTSLMSQRSGTMLPRMKVAG